MKKVLLAVLLLLSSVPVWAQNNPGGMYVPFGSFACKPQDEPYSANMVIDLSLGNCVSITATDGNAFAVANPSNALSVNSGAATLWVLKLTNSSGGAALGAITWGNKFKPTGVDPAGIGKPASGLTRILVFYWDGTNHWLVTETALDE